MEEERKSEIGKTAQEFSLKDQNGKEFKLTSFKGKRVLLSFHPLAWTEVCARQMKSLEENKKVLDSLSTIAAGINVDPLPSKQAWAKSLGIEKTSLLSDFWPHGEVAKLFGIFREKNGFSERANILLNQDQKIVLFKVYEISQLPDINEIINFIKKNL
ncbi:MAG: redoxin domain-containing protein [candidate division Zixibacteria bacterium]|nr:redoxin domain-containing protein [candidate division Zixibacteria bacterium]